MVNMGKQYVSSRQGTNLGQRKSIFEPSKFPQPSPNIIPSPETTDLSGYRQPQPGEMMANVMDSLSTSKSASPPNYLTGKQLPAPKRQEREVNMPSINQLKTPPRQSNLLEKTVQKQEESIPNQTGLPDNLKAGIENISGYSLDNVRVHYNSPKPAQLQALAYTQGTEIHVAPGQEKHLPHEAWHVVQQMQGRVKPTMQMKGVQINDDEGLEREADVMGERAKNQPRQNLSNWFNTAHNCQFQSFDIQKPIFQCKWDHLFNDIPKTIYNIPSELKGRQLEIIREELNQTRDDRRFGIDGLHSGEDENAINFGLSQRSFLTAMEAYSRGYVNDRAVRNATYELWKFSVDTEVYDVLNELNNKESKKAVKDWKRYEKATWEILTAHSSAFDFMNGLSLLQRKTSPNNRKGKEKNRESTINSANSFFPIQRQIDDSFIPRSYASATDYIDWSSLAASFFGIHRTPAQHLRGNLITAGVPDSNQRIDGTRNQAHHIVEVNDPNAVPARHLLYLAGIDINSAINGVFLPEYEADDTGNATVHFGSHLREYAEMVNQLLSQAVDSDLLLSSWGVTSNILGHMISLPPNVQAQLRLVLINALHQLRVILLTQSLTLNYGYRVDPDWKRDKSDGDGDTGASGGGSGAKWTRTSGGRLVSAY